MFSKMLPVFAIAKGIRNSRNLLSVIASNVHQQNNCTAIRAISTSANVAAKVPYILSDIGEGIRDVVIKEWFIDVGDKVSQFDDICEVQSDKASVTITSRYDGVVSKLHYNVDDVALVGKPLIDIEVPDENTSNLTGSANIVIGSESHTVSTSDYKRCIPSVRRMAKQYNVDLSVIIGSGKDGRILKEDIIAYMNKGAKNPDISDNLPQRTVKIKGFQKAMAKTMTKALEIPHMLLTEEINVTRLSSLRKLYNKEEDGARLTLMPFFIKVVSNALKRYPILNATVDAQCENLTYIDAHNIGIAMDTAEGLAVPVIKNVHDLDVLAIGEELNRLIATGRKGNFSPKDLAGPTFTISNIGVIAGTYLKPIILPPQVGILAIGTIRLLPRYDDKMNLKAQEIVNFSSSVDHRVIDGATVARFIKYTKRQIEHPHLIFLSN